MSHLLMINATPDQTADETCTDEIRALAGVFTLYWRMDEFFGCSEFTEGLSRMECHLMMQLDCPRRMGELARSMVMLPSSVTSAADRLEQDGLAVRQRDPDDRRAFRLELTPKGRDLRRRMEQRAAQAFRRVSGLNEPEIHAFAVLSAKIQEEILGPVFPRSDKER